MESACSTSPSITLMLRISVFQDDSKERSHKCTIDCRPKDNEKLRFGGFTLELWANEGTSTRDAAPSTHC